ncbi:20986_t:CDS:2 [Entrophospora sp. SA101]|nr:20986_t:CDS:2 [Entrophospora sp. SA101]CAJ0865929.1 13953_t:CDS:2 [Entrophospora sp. SA101]
MKESNLLVIISGVSGVGKSEVMKRLLTYSELNSQKLITTTTRSPRSGEKDGQDYYFISREEFREGIVNNQFLEHVEYNNNYYGTSLNSLKKAGKIISFWLQPPNRAKLLANLRKRGEREAEIKKRLTIAESEIPFAQEYDFILTVNDNLDQVAAEIKKKILGLV